MKSSSFSSRLVLTLGLTAFATFAVLAERRTQSQSPTPAGPQRSRFVEADFVVVDVTVTDRLGQQVPGLRSSDFSLLENNVAQPIETFAMVPLSGASGTTSYYLLGYRAAPAQPGGAFRKLQVKVDRPDVHVRSREGYYAQEDDFARGTYPEDTPDLVPPVVRERTDPKYTSAAMRAKIQGNVVVDAVVGTDGKVVRTRVSTSLDKDQGLDQEALAAVQQWKFTAGELNGDKVPVLMKVVVGFRLH
jgi:TonB family protein